MRGVEKDNYPAFRKAASFLRQIGWKVFSPAELDDIFSGPKQPIKRYIRRDTHVIINELDPENGDAVIVLDGWKQSVGANAEVSLARWCGLRILTIEEALDGDSSRNV